MMDCMPVEQFQEYVETRTYEMADQIHCHVDKVGVHKMKTMWGDNHIHRWKRKYTSRIYYNKALRCADQKIIDSVVAHEVTHLKDRYHDKKFWKLLLTLDPKAYEHKHYLDYDGHSVALLNADKEND